MNVIISSDSGYPAKFTPGNVKSEFVVRGLKDAGANVLFIDTLWGSDGISTLTEGVSNTGISYVTFPRNHGALSIFYNIRLYWKVIRQRKEIDGVNIYIDAPLIAFVNILCFIMLRLNGYKIALLSHEYYQSINHRKLWSRLNAWANDVIVPRFVDCIHPISHFLKDYNCRFKKPMIIVPILADYSKTKLEKDSKEQYFAFCGSGLYFLRNAILIESFKLVQKKYPNIKFKLVLGQLGSFKNQINNMISECGLSESIVQLTGIPQKELYDIYTNAIGLLIPLDPDNLQDKARFSQKIAEYVSCRRPIITSPVGEIPYYFKDKQSAIIADYTPEAYAEAMEGLITNLELADRVGQGGYDVGSEYFNYLNIGKTLFDFYSNL